VPPSLALVLSLKRKRRIWLKSSEGGTRVLCRYGILLHQRFIAELEMVSRPSGYLLMEPVERAI